MHGCFAYLTNCDFSVFVTLSSSACLPIEIDTHLSSHLSVSPSLRSTAPPFSKQTEERGERHLRQNESTSSRISLHARVHHSRPGLIDHASASI